MGPESNADPLQDTGSNRPTKLEDDSDMNNTALVWKPHLMKESMQIILRQLEYSSCSKHRRPYCCATRNFWSLQSKRSFCDFCPCQHSAYALHPMLIITLFHRPAAPRNPTTRNGLLLTATGGEVSSSPA